MKKSLLVIMVVLSLTAIALTGCTKPAAKAASPEKSTKSDVTWETKESINSQSEVNSLDETKNEYVELAKNNSAITAKISQLDGDASQAKYIISDELMGAGLDSTVDNGMWQAASVRVEFPTNKGAMAIQVKMSKYKITGKENEIVFEPKAYIGFLGEKGDVYGGKSEQLF